jgi:multidrug resistance efflux pump
MPQTRAEVRVTRAMLPLLAAGARPEELAEQRGRVERARAWRELAAQDLVRSRQASERELARLDEQVAQSGAELTQAQASLDRARRLLTGPTRGAISLEDYGEAEKRRAIYRHQLAQARDQKQAKQALGTLEAEAELARRAKELADARAALRLLEAGPRAEEVEAEAARLARLQEEVYFLEQFAARLTVPSPVSGVVTTPRLRERAGQFVHEGELLGVVEEPSRLDVEIAVAEQEVARVGTGQRVDLKARSLPYETFAARVERVAPAAAGGEGQPKVAVFCRLKDAPPGLRPGMTGHARVYTGPRSLAALGLDRLLRYVRTEFWW